MHISCVALLLTLALTIVGQDTSLESVKRAFDAADIPTDLAIRFNPSILFEVDLPQAGGRPVTLHAGIHLPRNATVDPPSFSIVGAGGGPFVVAAVDPDASPTVAQIRHFLGANFVARNPSAGAHPLTNSTPALSEFRQPSPPAGDDAHRYIFLLFNQPRGFNSQTLVGPTTPVQSFNISQFAASTGLGSPIGGTFMLVAADPPVV